MTLSSSDTLIQLRKKMLNFVDKSRKSAVVVNDLLGISDGAITSALDSVEQEAVLSAWEVLFESEFGAYLFDDSGNWFKFPNPSYDYSECIVEDFPEFVVLHTTPGTLAVNHVCSTLLVRSTTFTKYLVSVFLYSGMSYYFNHHYSRNSEKKHPITNPINHKKANYYCWLLLESINDGNFTSERIRYLSNKAEENGVYFSVSLDQLISHI